MEIIRPKDLEIDFSNIDRGECFSPVGSNLIYMRTVLGLDLDEKDVNAVELTNGTFERFASTCLVKKVKCQLIVE